MLTDKTTIDFCKGAVSGELIVSNFDRLYSRLPFPCKLYKLLQDAEKEGNESIVSWLPHGNAFKVHKPAEFASKIMKKYFRQTQFKSFTRQLYNYGFGKVYSAHERGAFYHSKFLKGDMPLCLSMDKKGWKCQLNKPSSLLRSNLQQTPVDGSRNERSSDHNIVCDFTLCGFSLCKDEGNNTGPLPSKPFRDDEMLSFKHEKVHDDYKQSEFVGLGESCSEETDWVSGERQELVLKNVVYVEGTMHFDLEPRPIEEMIKSTMRYDAMKIGLRL
jgi:hypothetical protein